MPFMKKRTKIGKKTKMNKFDVLTCIEDERWKLALSDVEEIVDKCKTESLNVIKEDVAFLSEPKNFSVNLNLNNDKAIQDLNERFRGMNKPTNVLSFANIDDEFFVQMLQAEEDVSLGDVMIAFETMMRESDELGISLHDHFCHLWVHGLLHILGFDHIKEEDRVEMEKKEIEILRVLQIENPYQE